MAGDIQTQLLEGLNEDLRAKAMLEVALKTELETIDRYVRRRAQAEHAKE